MTRSNCYISSSDPIVTVVYGKAEADDLFGVDLIEEYGSYLPEDLIARYKANKEEFWAIQDEIEVFIKDK